MLWQFGRASGPASLSARRAWIEISVLLNRFGNNSVALRKESVDRNHVVLVVPSGCWVALRKESVDRNFYYSDKDADWVVALRKESVDRNFDTMQIVVVIVRRSPQGERG